MLPRHLRRLVLGIFVVLASAAFAPAAFAATVSKPDGTAIFTDGQGVSNYVETTQTAPGEIDIYSGNDQITIAEDAKDDCAPINDSTNQVHCVNVSRFQADLLNEDDFLTAQGLQDIPATLNGGDGNDAILGGGADDVVTGGEGDDGYSCYYCFNSLQAGPACLCGGSAPYGLEGGPGNDIVDGGPGQDILWGGYLFSENSGDGNDSIYGGPGNDFAYGDAGNDTIDGGAGNDGDGNNNGSAGASPTDSANCACVTFGLYGGEGDDTITGGDGLDRVEGDGGNDVLDGQAGDDTVLGDNGGFCDGDCSNGNGNDTVRGGTGDDYVEGGPGVDNVDGGEGSDYIGDFNDQAPDTITGGPGIDNYSYSDCAGNGDLVDITLDGVANDGNKQMDPANNVNPDVNNVGVNLGCNQQSARLRGDDQANVLSGDNQADDIDGGLGPDRLVGAGGPDKFQARDGYPDYVDCGPGVDSVVADQFDTLVACENTDVQAVRSAYDTVEPPQPPPPPADQMGPRTTLGGKNILTIEQFLRGFNVTVTCDEDCKIQARLLASQPAGDVKLSKANGFNLVLGRKTTGFGTGKRTITLRPCTPIRSSKRQAECLARMKRSANRKGKFQLKVFALTTDRLGNKSEKFKIITVRKSRR